jgi:hypothetical protein
MTKPPASYGAQVKLRAAEPDPSSVTSTTQSTELAFSQAQLSPAGRRRPMEAKSDPTIIYLHPDGKYELKRYALARGPKVKVHDLLIEAIEEWGQRHGIAAPFRVPSARVGRS